MKKGYILALVLLAIVVTFWRPREGICNPPADAVAAAGRAACAENSGVWDPVSHQCTCPV